MRYGQDWWWPWPSPLSHLAAPHEADAQRPGLWVTPGAVHNLGRELPAHRGQSRHNQGVCESSINPFLHIFYEHFAQYKSSPECSWPCNVFAHQATRTIRSRKKNMIDICQFRSSWADLGVPSKCHSLRRLPSDVEVFEVCLIPLNSRQTWFCITLCLCLKWSWEYKSLCLYSPGKVLKGIIS